VLRTVGSKYAEFLFAVPVLAFFALVNRAELSWYVLLVPLAMLIQATLLVGAGLMLATLAVLYGDVERLMRILLRLLFYFSPIIYGINDVQQRLGDTIATFFILNPLTGIFDLYRSAFFSEEWSGWDSVGISAAWSLVLLVLGIRVFRRFEGTVLKEI